VPVPKLAPPVAALYQLMLAPAEAVAVRVTDPVPHLLDPEDVTIVGFTIVNVPVAAEDPDTEPADTVMFDDEIELTAMVCPVAGDVASVGTIKK